jgi:hypothetical protein
MNVMIADDRAPRHLEAVEFSTHYGIGATASIICYISRQEDKAHRTAERSIDLIQNLCQIEMVLLASLGDVQIAKMDPANDVSYIG